MAPCRQACSSGAGCSFPPMKLESGALLPRPVRCACRAERPTAEVFPFWAGGYSNRAPFQLHRIQLLEDMPR